MDANVTVLYPLHRSKIIHLVRHAQGFSNVAAEKEHSAYMLEEFFDTKITPLGWQQVDNLRKHVHSSGIAKRVELVIVSPLLRTLQTAVGVFGGGYINEKNISDQDLLMVKNALDSNQAAISSLDCPPFLAVELCRERLGVHPCDRRRNINEYKPLFPGIDFSQIESDSDILWKPDIREKNEDVGLRGMEFLNWLWTRKEKEIAVVTHSGLLLNTMKAFGNDCHPSVKIEICKPFNNCELRSVVIIDRGMHA
ncbi:phosphoglycerate mutase-like protein 1 [Impatiens glandulifera]|uniref:phosphoglycerate mutase-like protein 1 n=1 Tax=Impatiens glandulifera TaxID=253017 RepID=UPI001FB05845|nr:phosphoglycerate mutase-like protein 1 [Impatiens glandulifera]XP_047328477.1 phosphoglycerate mutase-like protein 1 [Impatiens glandulifera]